MNYALVGRGRMGRAIAGQAERRGHTCVATFDSAAASAGIDGERLADAVVAFEFTQGPAAERNATALLRAGCSVVCGTTGWIPSNALRELAARCSCAFMLAPNFSLGVQLFFRIADDAARRIAKLGLHEPYVHEAHHRGKRDMPSGTARRLAEILLEADPRLTDVLEGHHDGVLAPGVLQVTSIRAGAEPGRHTLGFDGAHDTITLSHRARSRDGFALGAVLAGEWIAGRSGWQSFDGAVDEFLARGVEGKGGAGE